MYNSTKLGIEMGNIFARLIPFFVLSPARFCPMNLISTKLNFYKGKTMSVDPTHHESENHGFSVKHSLLMMLCCILPVFAIVAIAFLFSGASYLSFLFILVCPLSMALMMLPNLLSKKKKTQKSCH